MNQIISVIRAYATNNNTTTDMAVVMETLILVVAHNPIIYDLTLHWMQTQHYEVYIKKEGTCVRGLICNLATAAFSRGRESWRERVSLRVLFGGHSSFFSPASVVHHTLQTVSEIRGASDTPPHVIQ